MSSSEWEGPSPWRHIAAFAPMCAVASAYWAKLLVDPPAWRIAAAVAIALACGLVLALSKRLEPYGLVAVRTMRAATVAVAMIGGPLAVGVPPEVIAPPGWEQLIAADLPSRWPYGGGDPGVRWTVLLAIPLMTVPAAAFALWPPASGPGGPEAAAARRFAALLLLLSLIGFAEAERPPSDPTARGALLLLALVAWLFLARVRAEPAAALAATALVVVAGFVSLPLAMGLEPGRPPPDRPSQERSTRPPSASSEPERRERARSRRQRRRAQQRRRDAGSANRPANRPRSPRRREREGGLSAGVAIPLAVVVALAVSLLVARRIHRRAHRGGSVADEAEELRTALQRLGWSVPPQTTLADLEHWLYEGAGPAAARYARRLRDRRFGALVDGPPSLDRRGLRRALTEGQGPLWRLRGLIALPPAALRLRR